MTYNFQNRLSHNSARMKELNNEAVVYVGLRGGVPVVINITQASPILKQAEEIDPGVSVTRLELQDWGIDVDDLGALFPPINGDTIQRASGEQFFVCPLSGDEPPYHFVRSTRNRLILHTKRFEDVT